MKCFSAACDSGMWLISTLPAPSRLPSGGAAGSNDSKNSTLPQTVHKPIAHPRLADQIARPARSDFNLAPQTPDAFPEVARRVNRRVSENDRPIRQHAIRVARKVRQQFELDGIHMNLLIVASDAMAIEINRKGRQLHDTRGKMLVEAPVQRRVHARHELVGIE